MKAAIVVAVMLAAGRTSALDPWTAGDAAMEAGFIAAVAVDWRQTHQALDAGHRELNPLLGARPSDRRLGLSVMGAALGHAAVSTLLPRKWRRWWQGATLAGEISAVGWNVYAGARLTF